MGVFGVLQLIVVASTIWLLMCGPKHEVQQPEIEMNLGQQGASGLGQQEMQTAGQCKPLSRQGSPLACPSKSQSELWPWPRCDCLLLCLVSVSHRLVDQAKWCHNVGFFCLTSVAIPARERPFMQREFSCRIVLQ